MLLHRGECERKDRHKASLESLAAETILQMCLDVSLDKGSIPKRELPGYLVLATLRLNYTPVL